LQTTSKHEEILIFRTISYTSYFDRAQQKKCPGDENEGKTGYYKGVSGDDVGGLGTARNLGRRRVACQKSTSKDVSLHHLDLSIHPR
jgi:hypothetical protein